MGLLCITGVQGASRGGLGGVAGSTGLCMRFLGWQSCVVKLMMHSGECVHATLHNNVSWAVGSVSASFMACWCVSCVGGAVRVLDTALNTI